MNIPKLTIPTEVYLLVLGFVIGSILGYISLVASIASIVMIVLVVYVMLIFNKKKDDTVPNPLKYRKPCEECGTLGRHHKGCSRSPEKKT